MTEIQTIDERLKERLEDREKARAGLIFRLINKRSSINMDTRIIIEGEAGVGKSWLSLRFAEILDDNFFYRPKEAVANQLSYSALQYIDGVVRQLPQDVLIYDEPAQSWHHREFMSDVNIILSKTMIGYRYKRYKSMLNIPNIEMIDKDARTLCKYLINVFRQGKAEVFEIKTQKFGGTPWYKKLVDQLTVKPPHKDLIEAYEESKATYQDKLYDRFRSQLSSSEQKEMTNPEIVQVIRDNADIFFQKGRLASTVIMGYFNLSRNRADALRAKLELEPRFKPKVRDARYNPSKDSQNEQI